MIRFVELLDPSSLSGALPVTSIDCVPMATTLLVVLGFNGTFVPWEATLVCEGTSFFVILFAAFEASTSADLAISIFTTSLHGKFPFKRSKQLVNSLQQRKQKKK